MMGQRTAKAAFARWLGLRSGRGARTKGRHWAFYHFGPDFEVFWFFFPPVLLYSYDSVDVWVFRVTGLRKNFVETAPDHQTHHFHRVFDARGRQYFTLHSVTACPVEACAARGRSRTENNRIMLIPRLTTCGALDPPSSPYRHTTMGPRDMENRPGSGVCPHDSLNFPSRFKPAGWVVRPH
ncbi:hypothetical protein EV126DRAFT_183123 [Verticillium dahliae]|nr:hypothetical protein EV126DRAFT_183123 [Verticillium dahliae]